MWASAIVKCQISADAGVGHGLIGVEIDLLVFDRPPEPFDEDIVPSGSLAIHGDDDSGPLQHRREVHRGKLRALIRIEDIGFTMTGKCRTLRETLCKSFSTECAI